MSNLSAVLWQGQFTFWWDDNVGFVLLLDQHAELDFYRASSLKEQSADIHVTPLGHIILILNQLIFVLSLTP